MGLAGGSWDRQGAASMGEMLPEAEQGREKYPGFYLLLPSSLPTVPLLPHLPGSQLTEEIYFPEMQSRIEERWGMDLRANRHMINTRR